MCIFSFLWRRQIRVFQSPWLLITSLALLDQGVPLHPPPCPGKTPVDATHAGAWRETTAFPTAGPGKGPLRGGVGAGVSGDDLRASTNIPGGVKKGRLWRKHPGVPLGITYLLHLPPLAVPRRLLERASRFRGLWWVPSWLTPCRTSAPVQSSRHPLGPTPTPDSPAEPRAPASTKGTIPHVPSAQGWP